MKSLLAAATICFYLAAGSAQSNSLNLAVIAYEKGHYENAWNNANAALQAPQNLDEQSHIQALLIRASSGARMAYKIFTEGEEAEMKQNLELPLQAYHDFKELLHRGDSASIAAITPEFYKLGHALYLTGTEYDKQNADNEKPDTLLLNKSIECYSATIELWQHVNKLKYKPYYYRGDAYLAKKKYDKAVDDFTRAIELYAAAARKTPDLGIGDLGYRLAYTQAGIFNQKEAALKTIRLAKELLDKEMLLAESKKDKLAEIFEDIKTEYDYLTGELNDLEASVKNESVKGAPKKMQ
ncbi:MAG TPA: tetratricopeptide repeat protein [Chitinophagales bacterium]|nr:tetratricopeptide repeat protein [Chitinophagales bacterium]